MFHANLRTVTPSIHTITFVYHIWLLNKVFLVKYPVGVGAHVIDGIGDRSIFGRKAVDFKNA